LSEDLPADSKCNADAPKRCSSAEFGPVDRTRRSGAEQFRRGNAPLDFSLLDFWCWSGSDLVSNATRGRIAEFIVANACGIPTNDVRDEWAAYDLELTPQGHGIEVKSAAYLQSWYQKCPSPITFRTSP
jgi:hypothetical protein